LDQLPLEETTQVQEPQQTILLDQLPPEVPTQAQGTPQMVLLKPLPPSSERISPGAKSKRKSVLFAALVLVLITFIVCLTVFSSHRSEPKTGGTHPVVTGAISPLSGLGEFKANGQLLGVNDGSFPPFTAGDDEQLKLQAANQLKQGHSSQAISLWQAATHTSNNDAEAWIYLENQRVLLSGLPYVTLVAGTDLGDASGANDLQGIYVAQHEFNTANHGFQLRILIANSGADTDNAITIAKQIVNVARQDKTVVGAISWLTSTENLNALPILSSAHIPMISPTASSDQLTNSSPYFLRVAPPNAFEGKESALFAEQTLHAHKVVIFVDNNDSYSQSVAQDFEDQFKQDGNPAPQVENFVTDHTSKIGTLIQDALATHPDLLYFTSRDIDDMANFQDALPKPTSSSFANIPVLAGDAGYVAHTNGYNRWYFASFAFANAVTNVSGISQPFYQDYSTDFDQDHVKPAGYYGYTRPDDVSMLAYDATSVFLSGIQTVIVKNKFALTSAGLQQVTPVLLAGTLPGITLQGVSGWIAFDANHNPSNKAIVFLAVSPKGIYMKDWQGCFTQSLCRNVNQP
jgi:ABC-type branched-subunit amino acid transport system substrate-binding protein